MKKNAGDETVTFIASRNDDERVRTRSNRTVRDVQATVPNRSLCLEFACWLSDCERAESETVLETTEIETNGVKNANVEQVFKTFFFIVDF